MNKPVPVLRLLLLLTLFSAVSCSKDKEHKELQGRWQHDTTQETVYEHSVNLKVSVATERISTNGKILTLDIGESTWNWTQTLASTGNTGVTSCTYTLNDENIRVTGHPFLMPDYKLRSVSGLKLVLSQERILPQQNTRIEYEHTFSRVR